MLSSLPGLLIVGHGTRSRPGREAFLGVVEQVERFLPGTLVQTGFLEAAAPDIETAVGRMAQAGCRRVILVPLLLFSAGHARRDIPAQARQAAQQYRIAVITTPVLGCHPRILGLSARRFRATIRDTHADPREVFMLMVGRGSRDAEATAQMHRFVRQRVARTPVGRVLTAFMAMADPHVESVIPDIALAPQTTVIVQPHLLFPGQLLCRLRRLVQLQQRRQTRQQWLVTDVLGGDSAVALAIVDRFQQTLADPDLLPK
jgi:sirohydrochlorin cobaltochelatase